MHVLIGIALKSLLIAGLTLGLLQLMKSRSAAERSWVAHIGLLALVIMAFAPLVLPSWTVEAPSLLGQAPAVEASAQAPAPAASSIAVPANSTVVPAAKVAARPSITTAAAVSAIYAVPAAILLFITLLALGRLITLRARADVLVDAHWLSALARAQRRMGFKHGTALLTSNELASPISWGLMRPVILLNSRAVEASGEAEAIIAHELAHVARMDWMKLLLARIATALFWFNPLVWMLAREAHQLREETADDAVLGADIADTDYAQLLVGVARHECPGLLLGAHGVAPSKNSLARRVARVLDGKSVRGPVARSFAAGVFAGAVLVAAPLAALTFTPAGAPKQANAAKKAAGNGAYPAPYYSGSRDVPTDLPSIIGEGVTTSVQTAVSAMTSTGPSGDFELVSPSGSSVTSKGGLLVSRASSGATVTVYPPDAEGRRKVVARAPNGAVAVSYADDDDIPGFGSMHVHHNDSALEQAMAMKAVGVTPEYMAAIRAVAPKLRDADPDDFVQMKAVGVTPDYVRDLASAGLVNLDPDELTQARAIGLSGSYVREMRGVGFGDADIDDLTGARAVGVTGDYIRQMRVAGFDGDLDDFTAMRAVSRKDSRPPRPPRPPQPPGG